MKISIIVPVYNSEKYLKKCIDSILNQTYDNWELILVDDGSKDKSYDICLEYSNNDKRIVVLQQLNKGSGPARNYGIESCTGEYLMFCDSDDFLTDIALEEFYNIINNNNSDLVISGYNEFKYDETLNINYCGENNATNLVITNKEKARNLYINFFRDGLIQAPWAKLYKSNILKQNNIKFPDLRRCQDSVFNIEYYDKINSLTIISDKLYNYQTPDGNAYIRKFPKDMIKIRFKIDDIIQCKLEKWNVYNEYSRKILNRVLITDILVCCRLNFMNNWNYSSEEQKEYIIKLVNDPRVLEVLSDMKYSLSKNILCIIMKTKNYTLIKFTNKIILKIISIKNTVL